MSNDFGQFQGWTPGQPVPGSREPVPGSREPVPGSQGYGYPPQAAPPQDTPPQGWAPPGPDPMAALREALDRIGQLERQLAQNSQGVGADVPKLTGPTHDLWLVDGTHVENTGAIPTHVHLADDRILPVAYAVAR